MKRPRFTLRFLLIVVTLAAAGLGVWRVGYVERNVTESHIERIKSGQRQWQVRLLLGPPHQVSGNQAKITWQYDIEETDEIIELLFEQGRVVSVVKIQFFPPGPEFRTRDGNKSVE